MACPFADPSRLCSSANWSVHCVLFQTQASHRAVVFSSRSHSKPNSRHWSHVLAFLMTSLSRVLAASIALPCAIMMFVCATQPSSSRLSASSALERAMQSSSDNLELLDRNGLHTVSRHRWTGLDRCWICAFSACSSLLFRCNTSMSARPSDCRLGLTFDR